MKLFTKDIEAKLLENYKANEARGDLDLMPVVKFFYMGATWLISEMNEDGVMFGLCDLGHGYPELGYVHRLDLEGLPFCERDMYFTASKTLSEYAKDARDAQYVIA